MKKYIKKRIRKKETNLKKMAQEKVAEPSHLHKNILFNTNKIQLNEVK
jgi:hypothetical protein